METIKCTYNSRSFFSHRVASEHSAHKPDINVSAPVEDGGDTENKDKEEEEKKVDENEEEPKEEKILFKNDLCEMFSDVSVQLIILISKLIIGGFV